MKYKIAVNETLSATRYIEVEYDKDIAELLYDVENSSYEENVASTLKKLGAIILKEDQPIVGEISDWETESLDYSVMLEEMDRNFMKTKNEKRLFLLILISLLVKGFIYYSAIKSVLAPFFCWYFLLIISFVVSTVLDILISKKMEM